MTAEWEQTFRTKIFRATLTAAERLSLGAELDRTAQELRDLGHYETGPRELILEYALKIRFFQQAKAEISDVPLSKQGSQGRLLSCVWNEHLGTTGDYLKPEKTLQELATQKGLTRERVRQITELTLMKLWVHCSPETQRLYPFFLLPQDKPATLERAIKRSEAGTGIVARVASLVNQGTGYPELLREAAGVQQLSSAREILKKHGVKVPYVYHPRGWHKSLLESLAVTADLKEIQKLLSQVTLTTVVQSRKSKPPAILSLYDAVYEAGFHRARPWDVPYFIKSLQTTGIPYVSFPHSKGSTVRYTILASSTKEQAKKALLTDPNLTRFYGSSVEQMAGPVSDKLPSVADITKRGQFISPIQVLSELGIRIGTRNRNYEKILDLLRQECPVELYTIQHGNIRSYHIPVSKKDQLEDYLRNKLILK